MSADPLELAGRLVAGLEAAQITCAIGGALALAIWAVPRATIDIDLNLFVDTEDEVLAIEALRSSGCTIDEDVARRRWRDGFAAFGWVEGVRVDLFTPSVPFYDAARLRVERIAVNRRVLPFLDAESLAVFKLLFFRPKDRVDLQSLVASVGPALDHGWVRGHLVEMMGEDDERVEFWDQLGG